MNYVKKSVIQTLLTFLFIVSTYLVTPLPPAGPAPARERREVSSQRVCGTLFSLSNMAGTMGRVKHLVLRTSNFPYST